MKSIPHRNVHIGLLIFSTLCADAALVDETVARGADDKADTYGALVEALVNKNPEPKIAKRGNTDAIALYTEDHKWREEVRVSEAFRNLWKHNGEELWPHLMKHLDDRRYAFVWRYANDSEWVERHTVGSVCKMLAMEDLTWALMRSNPGFDKVQYYAFSKPAEFRDLEAWHRTRANQPLHEAQIEMCHWSLAKIETLKDFDPNKKIRFTTGVKKTIDQLSKTTKPIVRDHWYREGYHFMGAENAKEYRQRAAANKEYVVQQPDGQKP